MTEAAGSTKTRVLRLRALAVAVPAILVLGGVVYLLLDGAVERAVEDTGSDIVGARVDLDIADLRLREGRIVLEGLQVANPDAPFTNLVEASDITIDIDVEPLLQKKLVADTVVVRGIRFGTPRETSGALEDPNPESGRLWREVNAWADSLNVPTLDLAGLGGVIDVAAIDDDSLSTLGLGSTLIQEADSVRSSWQAEIERLDPRPLLDSARAVADRLAEARQSRPGLVEATRLVQSARGMAARLQELQAGLRSLDSTVAAGFEAFSTVPATLQSSVDRDLAYARRLLRLPSLSAPTLSPIIFHETAISWLRPVLYWVNTAERYLPPGLDPARRPGPSRQRSPGTTVAFPGRATYPAFFLGYGALDMEIGGSGIAAGQYDGTVLGLSSAPALSGMPLVIEARRRGAPRGPQGLALRAVLDHATEVLRDSVRLALVGVGLPSVELGDLDAELVLGQGDAQFTLTRTGQEIDASFRWVSESVQWRGGPATPEDRPRIGTQAWTRDFLWRTLAGVSRVELDMGIRGLLSGPELRIRSNLGEALAESLRAEVGAEVARAETRLRAEVASRVEPRVAAVRSRLDQLEGQVAQIGLMSEEVGQLRTLIDDEIAALLRRIG